MTQFNLETTAKLSIQGYSTGELNIALAGNLSANEATETLRRMTSSFILTPNKIIDNWLYKDVSEWTIESFKPLLEQQPELVLLGTGAKLTFPAQQILQSFHQAGIGVEVMNTASACRTFNVLVSENRFVVAGLLII